VSETNDTTVRETTITRIFEAPRDAVWRAWTEPDQAKRWFMPHAFTVPECTIDLRVGGRIHMLVRDPQGNESNNDGEIVELDPPSKLVMTEMAFEGALQVLTSVTLEDLGGVKTELTLHAKVTTSSPEHAGPLAGMEEGWLQSLDKLDALLTAKENASAERQLVATRVLDAPRDAVWKAYTDPERVARWWAPPGHTIDTHEMDVRPGGVWRASLSGPHGDFEQTITYLAVQEPEVLAYLYGDLDMPGHAFTTIQLSDDGGKTTVTVTLAFASAEERARMVEQQWARQGLEDSLDRLTTFLGR
jgi:uncharacterized protein YndB with AHSA1/START domain